MRGGKGNLNERGREGAREGGEWEGKGEAAPPQPRTRTLTHTPARARARKPGPHLTRPRARPPAPSALLLTRRPLSAHCLRQQRLLPPRAGAEWALIVHGVHTGHFLEGARAHSHTPPARTRPRAHSHSPPRTLTPAHTHAAAAARLCSARNRTCNESIGRRVAARGGHPRAPMPSLSARAGTAPTSRPKRALPLPPTHLPLPPKKKILF